MLLLHALCDVRLALSSLLSRKTTKPSQYVLPQSHPLHHDGNLAPAHRRSDRRLRNWRNRGFRTPQPTTRTLDSYRLLHPLGNWHTPRYERTGHLLSAPYYALAATSRSHRLSLPAHWHLRPRW